MFTMTNYCVYMHNYPFINNKGHMHLCCKNNHYQMPGNIQTHTLKEMYFSKEYELVRQKMLEEIALDGCDICYNQEAKGEVSFRGRALNKVKAQIDKPGPYETTEIRNLDLRVGSTCNLMCSMCHPTDSSKWAARYESFAREVTNMSDKHIEMVLRTNKPNLLDWANHDQSWENIFCSIDKKLNHVYIAGGEPFYIKKFPEYLSTLLDKAPDAQVEINTNGTRSIDEKYINRFKNVKLRVSIDGFEGSEEYQRAGTDWKEKVAVMDQYYKQMNLEVFDITLTSLTIRTLPALIDFLEERYPGTTFLLRPVVNREGQRITNVPTHLLTETIEWLEKKVALTKDSRDAYWRYNNISQILHLLKQGYKDEKQTFKRLVTYWDKTANNTLGSFDPKLAEWVHADYSS